MYDEIIKKINKARGNIGEATNLLGELKPLRLILSDSRFKLLVLKSIIYLNFSVAFFSYFIIATYNQKF